MHGHAIPFAMFSLRQAATWLTYLDRTKIASEIFLAVLGAILLWWKGGIKWLFSKYRLAAALRKYRKDLQKDVSTLPIIGRKEGFDLNNVYVDINIAPSDLMSRPPEFRYRPPRVFVLVGGPGAGKSTYVKKELLDELNSKSRPIPFFLRLRDYEKGSSIEELLASHLKNYRIHDVELWVREFLREATPLCVLDGLDEVRPQILTDAYEAITDSTRRSSCPPALGV